MNSGKTLTAFVVVLVVSFAVMSVLPDDGLSRACLQEALLAAVAIGAVAFACPRAVRRVRCTNSVQHGMAVGAAVVLAGVLGGVITLAAWGFADFAFAGSLAGEAFPSAGIFAQRLVLLLVVCALTGAFEEAFMRVLAIEAFESLLGAGGEGADWAVKRAVLLSAVLFALLHVGAPDAAASATVMLQTLVKFAQVFLFGLVMGVLYARSRSLWPCAVAHAGFDALYLGPGVVLTGVLPTTYASGLPIDTALLCATTALLAIVAVGTWKSWAKGLV